MAVTSFLAQQNSPLRLTSDTPQGAITANGRTTWRLPPGPTYQRIFLYFEKTGPAAMNAAEIIAAVGEIRLVVDGDVKIRWTGRELLYFDLLEQEGLNAAPASPSNGYVTIHLAREILVMLESRIKSAYGTQNKSSVSIEIDWGASSVATDCVVYREVTAGEPLGAHITYRQITHQVSVTGRQQINDIPINPGSKLAAIHIANDDGTAHSITQVELEADGTRLINWPTELLVKADRDLGRGNENDSSILTIDFARRGRVADFLPMVMNSFILYLTTSSSGFQFNIISELIEGDTAKGV